MQGPSNKRIPAHRSLPLGIPDRVNRKAWTLRAEHNRDMKLPRNLGVRPASSWRLAPRTGQRLRLRRRSRNSHLAQCALTVFQNSISCHEKSSCAIQQFNTSHQAKSSEPHTLCRTIYAGTERPPSTEHTLTTRHPPPPHLQSRPLPHTTPRAETPSALTHILASHARTSMHGLPCTSAPFQRSEFSQTMPSSWPAEAGPNLAPSSQWRCTNCRTSRPSGFGMDSPRLKEGNPEGH